MSVLGQRDVTVRLLSFILGALLLVPNCLAADDSRDRSPSLEIHIGQLKAAEPKDRRSAADALAALGPTAEPAIPALAEALRDADVGVRNAAANALVNIGPKSSSEHAVTHPVLRRAATRIDLGEAALVGAGAGRTLARPSHPWAVTALSRNIVDQAGLVVGLHVEREVRPNSGNLIQDFSHEIGLLRRPVVMQVVLVPVVAHHGQHEVRDLSIVRRR